MTRPPARRINSIYVHYSKSSYGDVNLIHNWHKQRGWLGIGYHFVILNGYRTYRDIVEDSYWASDDGMLELGRDIEVAGAHVSGANAYSIGICVIAGNNPIEADITPEQTESLVALLALLCLKYRLDPETAILGHYDAPNPNPECPNFELSPIRERVEEVQGVLSRTQQYNPIFVKQKWEAIFEDKQWKSME